MRLRGQGVHLTRSNRAYSLVQELPHQREPMLSYFLERFFNTFFDALFLTLVPSRGVD